MTGRMRQSVAEALLALLDLVPEEPRGVREIAAAEEAADRYVFASSAPETEMAAMTMRTGADSVRASAGTAFPTDHSVGAAAGAGPETGFGEYLPYRVGIPGGMAEAVSLRNRDAAEELDRSFRRDSRRYDSGFPGTD